MGIVLRGPGIYVPPDILTNKDLVELVDEQGERVLDTNDEWIVQMSGIHERRISLDKTIKEMGILAVQNLQERLGEELNPDEIRFATNRHSNGAAPCYAAAIADAIGPKGSIITQDVIAGCTGLVYAISDAHDKIIAGSINSSIVGGVDRLTDCTNYADRSTCFIFGDGAGWYKLEKRDGAEGIIASVLGGIPDVGSKKYPHGHLSIPESKGKKIKKTPEGFVAYDAVADYLVMNGPKIFKFAINAMKRSIHDVLDKSDYKLSDVDVIVPHGANSRIIECVKEYLVEKGFKGVIYTNLDRYGNTSTASIPLAAYEAIKKEIIKQGSLVINVSFGAGFTWGANLVRATLD